MYRFCNPQLSCTVAIVPRGAYFRTPTGAIQKNPSFEGLSLVEAKKLKNYFHFRSARKVVRKTLAEGEHDKSIDFLDQVVDDIPVGSWSVQQDRGAQVNHN